MLRNICHGMHSIACEYWSSNETNKIDKPPIQSIEFHGKKNYVRFWLVNFIVFAKPKPFKLLNELMTVIIDSAAFSARMFGMVLFCALNMFESRNVIFLNGRIIATRINSTSQAISKSNLLLCACPSKSEWCFTTAKWKSQFQAGLL